MPSIYCTCQLLTFGGDNNNRTVSAFPRLFQLVQHRQQEGNSFTGSCAEKIKTLGSVLSFSTSVKNPRHYQTNFKKLEEIFFLFSSSNWARAVTSDNLKPEPVSKFSGSERVPYFSAVFEHDKVNRCIIYVLQGCINQCPLTVLWSRSNLDRHRLMWLAPEKKKFPHKFKQRIQLWKLKEDNTVLLFLKCTYFFFKFM